MFFYSEGKTETSTSRSCCVEPCKLCIISNEFFFHIKGSFTHHIDAAHHTGRGAESSRCGYLGFSSLLIKIPEGSVESSQLQSLLAAVFRSCTFCRTGNSRQCRLHVLGHHKVTHPCPASCPTSYPALFSASSPTSASYSASYPALSSALPLALHPTPPLPLPINSASGWNPQSVLANQLNQLSLELL